LNALETEQLRAKKKKHAFEARASAEREVNQQKIKTLLEIANVYYQQEKYQKGLECIEEVLGLDERDEEALLLREQILKAKQLADQIKEEEEKRKAAEQTAPAFAEVTPPVQPRTDDVWGAPTSYGDVSFGSDLTHSAPARPSVVVRIADRLSHVRISKKARNITLIVALVALVVYLFNVIRREAFVREYSLLVLPAGVSDSDSASHFLAAGLTSDLINDLAMSSDLHVINPVTALSPESADAGVWARSLSVNHFLRWNIFRSPDALDVELALFDTLSQESLWHLKMHRSFRDVASLRQEIAQGILGAMKLDVQGARVREDAGTQIISAYEQYARGRSMLAHPGRYPVAAAANAFSLAISLDSRFQDAQSALAWTHVLAFEASTDTSTARLDSAWEYSQAALQGGLKISEAFRTIGMVEQFRGNYDNATQHLEQAVIVAPNDAESQRRLAELYVVRGRSEDALNAAQRAAVCDPGNIAVLTTLGLVQQSRADFAAAARAYERASRLASDPVEYKSGPYADVLVYVQQPDRAAKILEELIARDSEDINSYYKLGRLFQSAGKSKQQWSTTLERAKYLLEARILNDQNDAVAHSMLSLVRYRLGRYDDAIAAKKRALELAPHDPEVLINIARMHALHRDKSEALEFLRLALDRRYRITAILDMDFFNLRSDSDFLSVITR
jgi:tetratricopeptide (TPR) repeat protein